MDKQDERYMQTALKLAARGIGSVEPNPAVGCVIVKSAQVIGKGWHRKFGENHAEINALENCEASGADPAGATMYITLEPCCHQGRTPPCTDAIISAKLAKVVVAAIDPSGHANGKGIRQLRKAGIKVDVGLCYGEATVLNAPFLKFALTGKTWVTLKWAQSIDGKLAWTKSNYRLQASRIMSDKRRWISNEQSRTDAHKLRRRAGAILVGINTVLRDDPLLTPRPNRGKKPLRIILDDRLRVPLNCRLLATANDTPVLIVTQDKTLKTKAKKAKQVIGKGAELLACHGNEKTNLHFLLKRLSKRGIQSLLVEGGPKVIGSFLKENLADEIVVYIAPRILGAEGCADIVGTTAKVLKSDILYWCNIKDISEDVRISGLTRRGFKTIF